MRAAGATIEQEDRTATISVADHERAADSQRYGRYMDPKL
jgi:hypothetical protein